MLLSLLVSALTQAGPAADRFSAHWSDSPYEVGLHRARLETPQWVGEPGVDAVVVLSIDDMSRPGPYEDFLRPLLDRLKQIDGRAPVSIFTTNIDPGLEPLQRWRDEGLSFEVHTLHHPCPCLQGGDLETARWTVHGCVDRLFEIPDAPPVCYRMPCCDSMNSVSPRAFAEILLEPTERGHLLPLDSSVFCLFTSADPALPSDWVFDVDGRERFRKYVPYDRRFVNVIENYPYPYVVQGSIWQIPSVVPSDWAAQHRHGVNDDRTVEDWKRAVDAVVAKRGVMSLVFHPHGWIRSDQLIELVDYTALTYGPRVKFLQFAEVERRLRENLLHGDGLVADTDGDGGARVLDLDGDGFMDVLGGRGEHGWTRRWDPGPGGWVEGPGLGDLAGLRLGVVDGSVAAFRTGESARAAWSYTSEGWRDSPALLRGLEPDVAPATTRRGADGDARLLDIDGDGSCEWVAASPNRTAVFRWDPGDGWGRTPWSMPSGVNALDEQGRDAGLRWHDLDRDGDLDLVFANGARSSVHRFESMAQGWSTVSEAADGDADLLPAIVRPDGSNGGAWFHSGAMWWQNEDTADLPQHVDSRSFAQLLGASPTAPVSDADAASTLHLEQGLRVQLAASAPLVMDPVAFDWSADGRLFVVEMGDYPQGVGNAGVGRVVTLTDSDGDWVYDDRVALVEGLAFPTGVTAWRDGALITCAPDILYAVDADGDGRAERVEKMVSGFVEGNPQHRVNGLRWGLDHWFYGANGDSGGDLLVHATGARVPLGTRDFRWRPGSGEFEPQPGPTQFGLCRDAFGSWFGGNNSHPLWFSPRTGRAPRRTAVPFPSRRPDVVPPNPPVFPVQPAGERFNTPGHAGRFTSACSPELYGADLLGRSYAGNLFVCEPVHQLVHRRVLRREGRSFVAERAHEEATREFLASSDPWFRPVFIRTGPDGGLWIADMQRAVIEHPEWIPDDVEGTMDLREGHDHGRIWRVLPRDGRTDFPGWPATATTDQLVERLSDRNGWHRDWATRRLVAGVAPLDPARLGVEGDRGPWAQVHALSVLVGRGSADVETLLAATESPHAEVRAFALRRVAERLRAGDGAEPLVAAVARLAEDSSPVVRGELVDLLAEWDDPRSGDGLARLAREDLGDPWWRARVWNAVQPGAAATFLQALVPSIEPSDPEQIWPELGALVAGFEDAASVAFIDGLMARAVTDAPRSVLLALERWVASQRGDGGTLLAAAQAASPMVRSRLEALTTVFESAERLVVDDRIDARRREAALLLLGQRDDPPVEWLEKLVELIGPRSPPVLQARALEQLARVQQLSLADRLIEAWRGTSPTTGAQLLAVLLQRKEWTEVLLRALDDGRLRPQDIDGTARHRLVQHSDAAIAKRAARVLEVDPNPDRTALVRRYVEAVGDRAGEEEVGRLHYERHCAACHEPREGVTAGPDLRTVQHWTASALIAAILDPNLAVDPRYLASVAWTRDGRVLDGVVVDEDERALVLRSPEGQTHRLDRGELLELRRGQRSAMAEGLEEVLDPDALVDLIAFLRGRRSPRREFEGNRPAIVRPADDGSIRLAAAEAAMYGSAIVYESDVSCLGYWSSLDDQAVWSFEIDREGRYDVTLEYACADGTAGNRLRLSVAGESLEAVVPGTGGWSQYEELALGAVSLGAGRQALVVRAVPPLHQYLFDLRAVRLTPRFEEDDR